MEIYAEYFFLENLIADGIVAGLTVRLWRVRPGAGRYLFAVLLMTLFSFFIFLPCSRMLLGIPVKAAFSLLVVKVLFPDSGWKAFLQQTVTFWGVTAVLGGLVSGVIYFLEIGGISGGGAIYVSPGSYPVIVISLAAAAFFAVLFFNFLCERRKREAETVEVQLKMGEKSCCLSALVDTGNYLRDPVEGLPVMLGEAEAVRSLIAENYEHAKIRIIPYSSVGTETGTLLGVKVEEILIRDGNREYRGMPAVLAIYNGSFGLDTGCSAILHPDILKKEAVEKCC